MKRSAIIIFATVFLLAALVTGGLYWQWVNSPRYALQQMVLAMQTKNLDKFINYIDLQEISINLVDAGSEDLTAPEKPDMDEMARLGRRLGEKAAKFIVPKLLEKFEKQIKEGVKEWDKRLIASFNETEVKGKPFRGENLTQAQIRMLE